MRLREREAAESRERALEELRRSEVRRAGAERLAALGRLAAGVAHEINNPLAFVNSNVGFALRELAGLEGIEPDVLQALQDSQGGLERMKRIVVELRGFSRDSADGPGPTEILPAIETARRTLAARLAAVAPLEVEAAPDLPLVVAHRGELVQVLVNLLGNALDAMEPAAVAGRPGLASIRVERAGGGLELAVDDAGPGFSEEALRHAFAPFFSTKGQGGTGLGLALSRELVERWGGRITAANRPGGGACVVIALRLAEAQEVTGAMAVGGAAPRGAQASDGVSSAASQGRSGAPG
jgi:C4-dicarboxylate-specific signal transduction histidine kinase